ncbi:MAG: hypothetical protein JSS71_06750 [Armatimonadetes bacterium]|nr:hypothetical protein [Armatimonadota bacterium]MBX3107669.1 hypothetical protein [Fimbriimonadaceae bacterium]
MNFRPLVSLRSLVLAANRVSRSRTVVTRGSDDLARRMIRSVKRLGGS